MLSSKICKFMLTFCPKRHFLSSLYITDDKAQTNFSLLRPVIDFEKQLENKECLFKSISSRCLDINLNNLIEKWKFFQFIHERKCVLEQTKIEIGHLISELMKNSEKNKDDIEKLMLHIKLVKDDLKNVKTFYYGVEEDTMLAILNLPNTLHEKTPFEHETVTHTYLEKINGTSENHIDIGTSNGLLKYVDSYTCFLKSDAALFEFGLFNYFRDYLENFGYSQFVSPNFCKSVIAEGCGEVPSMLFSIIDEESDGKLNQLHLCGGSSLFPFMAYFSRHIILKNTLPLRCFSLGKKYQPVSNDNLKSLFNLKQQSNVSFFTATSDEETSLESIISEVKSIYENLGYHFRIVILTANQLDKTECLRLSIQMFSNFLNKYIEVGHISLYDTYLSKRLLVSYIENKQHMFPKIISGSFGNVTKILGCLLESNSLNGASLINDPIKKYVKIN